MSRSRIADEVLDAFLASLRELGATVRDMGELARDFDDQKLQGLVQRLGQAGRQVFLVKGVGFVNIHVSASESGFWGIQESVRNDFEALAKIGPIKELKGPRSD